MKATLNAQAPTKTFAEKVALMVAALRGAYDNDLVAVRSGRRVQRTFDAVVSSVGWIKPMQLLFDANPVVGYVAAAQLRRELTSQESKQIAGSTEVKGQGLLPCAEPAQEEIFIQSPVRVTSNDENGEAFVREAKRVVRMARAVAQMEDVTLYVRYVPNVVTRGHKGAGKNALRARFGGRLYASDRATHGGSLLAIVTPNPSKTPLASAEWQVPGFEK